MMQTVTVIIASDNEQQVTSTFHGIGKAIAYLEAIEYEQEQNLTHQSEAQFND